ncbi:MULTISPECIES: hypothetical protein [Streptomyces]|uniref:hypothetical protein n=1 Tax=Streptomyces TaxID=1883 RepID=UPI001587933D|nr:hypothetical protein [Streptomyces sp. CAI-85]MBO7936895.1 hypothetical protein [Streptomyces sp. S9]NUV64050.1 hypothetical protein [Streptomyces sp. CAI-85]
MTDGTAPTDSPATLYGPVSLVLGVVATVTAALSGFIGIAIPLLAGALAITFGLLGLGRRLNRGLSAFGVATGSLGVLYPVFLVALLT